MLREEQNSVSHALPDEIIERAARLIRSGGLVAFPTETVYGLTANMYDEAATKRIYITKKRPTDNPLILHIHEFSQLYELAHDIYGTARICAERFWPGPLTVVLPKKPSVPLWVTGGLNTVAIRFPSNEVALKLIKATGIPLPAPSANPSGKPSPTSALHVSADYPNGEIDMIIDGGDTVYGLESTVIDLSVSETPILLRPGGVTTEMLTQVFGLVDGVKMDKLTSDAPKAPGMKYKHYAPDADMTIYSGAPEDVVSAIISATDNFLSRHPGKTVGILTTEQNMQCFTRHLQQDNRVVILSVGDRNDLTTVSHKLFGCLRDFDSKNVDIIYAEGFKNDEMGLAVMNRLSKAASGRIKYV